MNYYEIRQVKKVFAELFVFAVENKINLNSFTSALEKSEFINSIEKDRFIDLFNKPIKAIFRSIIDYEVDDVNVQGIFNDAYWAGQYYFDLFIKIKKPFSYLFLKLPLEKMMVVYDIFHEMDFSSFVEYFNKIEKEKTILRLLCERKKISISNLSKETNISFNTLLKYNFSDDTIYKASFQNIIRLVDFFQVPISLFKISI